MEYTFQLLRSQYPNVPTSVIEQALKLLTSGSPEQQVLDALKELHDSLETSPEEIRKDTASLENFVNEWESRIKKQELQDEESAIAESEEQILSDIEDRIS